MSNNPRRLLNRRQFLTQLAERTAALSALGHLGGPANLLKLAGAVETLARRRHLVTLQPTGASGYDSLSFHGRRELQAALAHVGTPYALRSPVLVERRQYQDIRANSTVRPAECKTGLLTRECYLEKYGGRHVVSDRPDGLLAAGVNPANYLFWHGMDLIDAGHDVSLKTFNGGASGPYTTSYSSLIAKSLAASLGKLPLQHVHLSSRAIFAFLGIHGAAPPIWISSEADVKSILAIPSGYAPTRACERTGAGLAGANPSAEALALQQLTESTVQQRIKRQSSRSLWQSFSEGVAGLELLRSNFGAASRCFEELSSSGGARFTVYRDAIQTALSRYKQLDSENVDFTASVDAESLKLLAHRFALTEWLIEFNLSAVIDIECLSGDYHQTWKGDFATTLANLTCFETLRARLEAKGLLQYTTLVFMSEFDRGPYLSSGEMAESYTPANAGTPHGDTASAILCGAGIRTGDIGLLTQTDRFEAFFQPRPVNLTTGVVDFANGTQTAIESFFPTILGAFDLIPPGELVTSFGKVPRALKSG